MALTYPNPLHEFLPTLTPPPSIREELGVFDPAYYFKTTGDALMKLDLGLQPDLIAYQSKLQGIAAARPGSTSVQRFLTEVGEGADAIPKYREALLKIRGAAVHLETSFDPDEACAMRVRPVNPRAKGADQI